MKGYLPLQNFWKRYNKVLLDKLSLDKEKSELKNDNSKLRTLLKQYLEGKCAVLVASESARLPKKSIY